VNSNSSSVLDAAPRRSSIAATHRFAPGVRVGTIEDLRVVWTDSEIVAWELWTRTAGSLTTFRLNSSSTNRRPAPGGAARHPTIRIAISSCQSDRRRDHHPGGPATLRFFPTAPELWPSATNLHASEFRSSKRSGDRSHTDSRRRGERKRWTGDNLSCSAAAPAIPRPGSAPFQPARPRHGPTHQHWTHSRRTHRSLRRHCGVDRTRNPPLGHRHRPTQRTVSNRGAALRAWRSPTSNSPPTKSTATIAEPATSPPGRSRSPPVLRLLGTAGWTLHPLMNAGGPGSFASFVDPSAPEQIVTYEANGGSFGLIYNRDGSVNLPGALQGAGCPVASSKALSANEETYTCSNADRASKPEASSSFDPL